jgi:hypothetical protein
MDILQKMKDLFGKKPTQSVITSSNSLLDIIKNSGISSHNLEILTKNGTDDKNIKNKLKSILCFNPKHTSSILVVENIKAYTAFQIAKVANLKDIVFTYSPGVNLDSLSFKSGIKYKINKDVSENCHGLIVCESGQANHYEHNVVSINTQGKFTFLSIDKHNFGKILNEVFNNSQNILGFSSSTSVLDARYKGINQLIHNICEIKVSKREPQINEMDLMKKFQSGQNIDINFDEILFSLSQVDMVDPNMLAAFGVKITPEMKKALAKQKAIIQSMTFKERKHPNLINTHSVHRIAKGSGSSIEEVNKMISMIDMIKKNGAKMGANFLNPAAMFNMNQK